MIWGALWCFTLFRLTVQKLSAGQYLIIEMYEQLIIGIVIDLGKALVRWCLRVVKPL